MFIKNGKNIVLYDGEDTGGGNPSSEAVEVVETPPVVEEHDYSPPEGSGLANILSQYLPDETADDFVVEGLSEEKAALVKAELANENPSIENLQDFTDEEIEILKKGELFKASESNEPEENINTKLEDMDKEALINEVKAKQRLISERDIKLKELESTVVPEGQLSQEELNEWKAFKEGLRTDLKGTWSKFKDKYKLPDFDLAVKVGMQGSIEDRLSHYQETVLRKEIEKQFNLEEGEFEVVREDLYDPKKPSYHWRKGTEKEERRLEAEVADLQESQVNALKANQEQQIEDVKWYAKKYHNGNEDEVYELVKEINAIPLKIKAGELSKEAHPFNVRNLLIAANHEKLVKLEVDKALADLTKQYNEKGFYIQGKELPVDVTSQNGKPAETKDLFDKKILENSPMMQSIQQLI